MKRLEKSNNRVICGVCGGIAKYFNVDPTIVRLIFIVAVILGFGSGILIYILAALIMPSPDYDDYEIKNMKSANMNEKEYEESKSSGEDKNNSKIHSDKDFNDYFN